MLHLSYPSMSRLEEHLSPSLDVRCKLVFTDHHDFGTDGGESDDGGADDVDGHRSLYDADACQKSNALAEKQHRLWNLIKDDDDDDNGDYDGDDEGDDDHEKDNIGWAK